MAKLAPCELDPFCAEIEQLGFAFAPLVISNSEIELILAELDRLPSDKAARREQTYAARNLLQSAPSVARLANGVRVRALASSVIGTAFPVRGILFDKVPARIGKLGGIRTRSFQSPTEKKCPALLPGQ